ncbi:hypothetical protein N7516_003511 [Penicillium verrucosum]|uniref:uncharacterized protein n=1 Tax=Penicillium verrucosum TaxID=60171 RepID=UPI002544F541|nr:uncharacterized protein N7516_003511 [Penicillium verrucosum]KAJ5943343.1 hypothetical protein N7516_003511 [Penicillium verrucosum]
MNVKGPGSLFLLNKTLSSQLHVTYVRSLSTTFRALEAQDSQGHRNTESKQEESNQVLSNNSSNQDNKRHAPPPKAKTVSQADAELRERLEQMSGAGGASGIEYEDGKPNAMKRGVRNNMFRLI